MLSLHPARCHIEASLTGIRLHNAKLFQLYRRKPLLVREEVLFDEQRSLSFQEAHGPLNLCLIKQLTYAQCDMQILRDYQNGWIDAIT